MPLNTELEKRINFRKNSQPIVRAQEIVSKRQLNLNETALKLEQANLDNISQIFSEIQKRDSAFLLDHPFVTSHPNFPISLVVVISLTNGIFCQPLIDKQSESFKNLNHPNTTIYVPTGEISHKLIDLMNGQFYKNSDLDFLKDNPRQSAMNISDFIFKIFLTNNVGCVKILGIEKNLQPMERQLLPIPVVKQSTIHDISEHNLSKEGESDKIINTLTHLYTTSVIYDTLLQTQSAEFLSRALTSHRAFENMNETLPVLQAEFNTIKRSKITSQILEQST
jgi:F0F1-type ATP synthase gamma subunit